MTLQERVAVLEQETAASKARMDRTEDLLLQLVQANNRNALTVDSLAGSVKVLADKIDQFVDAVFNRPNSSGKTE